MEVSHDYIFSNTILNRDTGVIADRYKISLRVIFPCPNNCAVA